MTDCPTLFLNINSKHSCTAAPWPAYSAMHILIASQPNTVLHITWILPARM